MLSKTLRGVAFVFIAAMIVNTVIALYYRWPAMFDAPGNPETIATDFIFHGTRISPPIHALIILTIAALCTRLSGWRGVASVLLLIGFSVLGVIAAAGEPSNLPANNVPLLLWTILGTVGRYAPPVIIALGIAELLWRRAERRGVRTISYVAK